VQTALITVILYLLPEGMLKGRPLSSNKPARLSTAYWVVATAIFVSQAGTWGQTTAFPVAVQTVTPDSGRWLGIYGQVIALVSILCPILGGFLADRFPAWFLVLVTQAVAVSASGMVWYQVAEGSMHLWTLVDLSALVYAASTIGGPAQTKFVLSLVNKEVEERAIAVNSLFGSIAKVGGPAIAGLALLWIKPRWLFLSDSGSYLPLLAVLLVLVWIMASTKSWPVKKSAPGEQQPQNAAGKAHGDGIRDEKSNLRLVFLVHTVVVIFTYNGAILNPLMASQVFHSPGSYGLLISGQGAGQILALSLVARTSRKSQKPWLLRAGLHQQLVWATAFCMALIGYSLSWSPTIGVIMMVLVGGAAGPYTNMVRTMVQTTKENVRGRLVGLQASLRGVSSWIGEFLTSHLLAGSNVRTVNIMEAVAPLLFIPVLIAIILVLVAIKRQASHLLAGLIAVMLRRRK